eukprot:g6650.t1
MNRDEDRGRSRKPLLLGTDVSRGFVVRSGKQWGKRGGIGAVRIRETYLREDGLLVRMGDSLLGEGGREEITPPFPTEAVQEGREDKNAGGGGGGDGTCYVCPTADFLHCYLELFGRPSFAACFQQGGRSSGGGVEEGPTAGCRLLLLHSELSKLTGAAGALSMKQERHLAQLARTLPGTMVFFDKFCPDLHLHDGARGRNGGGGGGDDGLAAGRNPSACRENAAHDDTSAPSSGPAPRSTGVMMAAACRWCSEELGNAAVVVLSEGESGGWVGADGRSCLAGKEGGEEGAGGGGTGVLPRVLGLREFLRDFVGGGEAGEELARRGDLLRSVHLSSKAATTSSPGEQGTGSSTTSTATSPLAVPHPSKTQLEALVAGGGALKGKLDVFEHNPREGFVVVGAGGGAEALEGWTDVSGRTKVLIVGREGMNRSIHGDTVAVTLLPKRRWRAATDRKRLTHAAEEEEGIGIPLVDEYSQGEDEAGGGTAPPGAMPTGFVVGVMEEGRRPYVVTIPPEETIGSRLASLLRSAGSAWW